MFSIWVVPTICCTYRASCDVVRASVKASGIPSLVFRYASCKHLVLLQEFLLRAWGVSDSVPIVSAFRFTVSYVLSDGHLGRYRGSDEAHCHAWKFLLYVWQWHVFTKCWGG